MGNVADWENISRIVTNGMGTIVVLDSADREVARFEEDENEEDLCQPGWVRAALEAVERTLE